MLKNISKLGQTLNKAQQRAINGGKINCYYRGTSLCSSCSTACAQPSCQQPDCTSTIITESSGS